MSLRLGPGSVSGLVKGHGSDWTSPDSVLCVILGEFFFYPSIPSLFHLPIIYPYRALVVIVKYEAISLCLHEISMSIDLCDCTESFKQW